MRRCASRWLAKCVWLPWPLGTLAAECWWQLNKHRKVRLTAAGYHALVAIGPNMLLESWGDRPGYICAICGKASRDVEEIRKCIAKHTDDREVQP